MVRPLRRTVAIGLERCGPTRTRLRTGPKKNERPGQCSQLAPAHPPGATRKVERSTTDRSTGVSLRLDQSHRPSRTPRGFGGRCPFRPAPGCPNPLPFDRSRRLPDDSCRPDHIGWLPSLRHRSRNPVCWLPSPVVSRRHIGCPMTVPPGRIDRSPDLNSRRRNPGLPVTRPRWLLDAVHADPVNRAIA